MDSISFSKPITKRKNVVYDFVNKVGLTCMIDNNFNINQCTKKSIIDFNKLIHNFGGKISYIKSGSTGHTFKGTTKEGYEYAIKIVSFSKKGDYGLPDNITRPENAELKMLKILSELVILQQTPHLILPIATFYSRIESFTGSNIKKSIINTKKYEQFMEKYMSGNFHKYCSILISEWADGGDLLDFFRMNYKKLRLEHWRNIFFQILAGLAIIQDKYPNFRHNDLKANNILVQHIDQNKNEFRYNINNKIYSIPNIGIQIKIWDFDFACIPNEVENAKVNAKWTTKINVTEEKNRYYDIHYFFCTLIKKGFFPEILKEPEIDKSVKDFVLRVVPIKLLRKSKYVSDRGRLLINKEITTPNKLISRDHFFEIYRNFYNN